MTARPPPAAAQPATGLPPGASEPVPVPAEQDAARRRLQAEPAQPRPRPLEEPRSEPGAGPSQAAPQPAPEPPARPAAPAARATSAAAPGGAQPAAGRPGPRRVARIVSAGRPAFEQCIAESGKGDPALDLSGRRIVLTLTVNPNGSVAAAAVDDAEIDGTDLGACLKGAARLMTFPPFEGDPMQVEVPLALGR
ncbi:MAG TPA: AgmX/PglI C-terminal domain-containing protein [Anaeromyxobacteraceae bacterium]|nr:AgmX/PglI C-terminal domain-containing protein [Anaeromyxobacteraceae bacterium]